MTLLLLFHGITKGNVITSTRKLRKPVNCVLAGQQNYEKSYRTFEGSRSGKLKYKSIMKRGSLRNLYKGD